MANGTSSSSHAVSKSSISKWLANKSPNLSFNRRRSKSSLSPSSSPSSPISIPNLQSPKTDKHDELTKQVFRRFDQNDDGKISALELRSYFGSIGEYMSDEQATAVIGDFDGDGDGLLDFEEFLKLMERSDGQENYDHDLKSAFEMFELEDGCITAKSVQRMLGRLGDTRSYHDCKAMLRAFDKDGNGVLDYNEFRQMMTA